MKWILSTWVLLWGNILYAQNSSFTTYLDGSDNLHSWHVVWHAADIPVTNRFPIKVRQLLQANEHDSFALIRTFTDQLGQTHQRFQHYFKGNSVFGSEIIVHSNHDMLIGFNGHFYATTLQPIVLEADNAFAIALSHINASVYKWQMSGEDSMLKIWTDDPSATYLPKSKLIYVPRDLFYDVQSWALCHEFDIYSHEPHGRWKVWVNAENGTIWAEEEQIHIIDADGMANTRYSGMQRITTDSLNPTNFRLRETGRGGGIETYNLLTGSKYASAVDFTDSNNFWDNANPAQDEIATDAHWGAEWTYDYFWNKFARNSFDDQGAKIYSYVHYGKKYNNAFWNGSVMTYGDGDSNVFTPLTCIDVCGHEIAHAVTTNTAGLIYKNESGALNESFSDIFGNAIEQYARPAFASWKIGEDITPSGNGIRHMHNPNGRGHPDTYKGTNWRTGSADNGGVHSNSGVQNFWFYLLCEGGTGTNDNSNAYSVDSIGINKAEAVAYRNLSVYLTASSPYSDARYFAIRSAEDLFGACSDEVIAVTNAWHAVGVGARYDSSAVVVDFTSDTNVCYPNSPISFVNKSSNARSYLWRFGDGDTSTQINPKHTYTTFGTFSVKLNAVGCYFGVTDSIVKVNHITIDSNFNICNATLMSAGKWDTIRRCTGFIYDNGGEGTYRTLIRDTLTIVTFPSDSMQLVFTDFDFEDKYDSLYIYDGPNTSSPLIGGYTGSALPKGGKITAYSGYITLRQFADPFVTGRGFKAELKTFRKPLQLAMSADTLVCFKQQVQLNAYATGGYAGDYRYYWNGKLLDSTIKLTADNDTTLRLLLEEYCMKEYASDSIVVTVRPPLELVTIGDTTVCYRQSIKLKADIKGGDTANRSVTWMPMNVVADSIFFKSDTNVVVTAILQDNCSGENDTSSFKFNVLPALVVATSPDTTVCYKSMLNLRATGTGGLSPYVFSWDQGLGTGPNKSLLSTSDIQYRVILSDNCSGENDTAYILVNTLDPVTVTTSPDTTVCYSSNLQLRVRASGGDSLKYNYAWSNGLGNSPDHQLKPTSSNTYKVVVSDACSGQNANDSVEVTVLTPLDISIQGPDTACYGEQVFFTTTSSGGRPAFHTFQWSNGMGNNSTASTNATTGVQIRVVLSDGCTGVPDTAAKFLYVRPKLALTTLKDSTICSGDSILVWTLASGGVAKDYQYFWDNSGGSKPSFLAAPKFTTKYKVTLFDNCSSFVEDSITIAVNATPKIGYSAAPNPQCVGQPVNFTNNTPGANLYKNTWWFGDGTSSNAYEPSHVYTQEGLYKVGLMVTNNFNCSDSTSGISLIEIIPAPVAMFDHIPDVATVIDKYFNFNNLSKNASTYSWDFGDGQADTTFNAYHEYADTGYYDVTLTAVNSIGCVNTLVKKVRVKDVYLSHIPNAITPNSDGLNEIFKPYVKGLKSYELTIYNRWGELIFKTKDVTQGWEAKSSDGTVVPAGIYLMRISGLTVDGERISESGYIRVLL